jgi:hypothetical protein
MSIERFSRTIPASGAIEIPRGNFCLLLSATGSVDLRLENGGSAEGFSGISGGVLIRRIKPWDQLRILGAAGITVVYFVGYETTDRDEADIRLQIATIAGVASVSTYPFQTITDRASVTVATATQSTLFAANTLRRQVRVFVDENNAGSCYARAAGGGANNLVNLQPGSAYTFAGIYGLDVRNDSGANATFYICEEN